MTSVILLSNHGELYGINKALTNEGMGTTFYVENAFTEQLSKSRDVYKNWRTAIKTSRYIFSNILDNRGLTREVRGGNQITFGVLTDEVLEQFIHYKSEKTLQTMPEHGPYNRVYVARAYNPNLGWITPQIFFYSYDRFMERDKGVRCEMGSIAKLQSYQKIDDELFTPFRANIESLPTTSSCFVCFDITIHSDGIYINSVMPSVPIFLLYSLKNLYKGTWTEFLNIFFELKYPKFDMNSFTASVLVTQPPFPYNQAACYIELPERLEDDILTRIEHKYFYELPWGHLVTSWATTVYEVKKRVYRSISNLDYSKDFQYRVDIGYGFEELFGRLQELGYAA